MERRRYATRTELAHLVYERAEVTVEDAHEVLAALEQLNVEVDALVRVIAPEPDAVIPRFQQPDAHPHEGS